LATFFIITVVTTTLKMEAVYSSRVKVLSYEITRVWCNMPTVNIISHQPDCAEHPASNLTGTVPLSSGIKWPRSEASHSSCYSTQVKNQWSYTTTPTMFLHSHARDIIYNEHKTCAYSTYVISQSYGTKPSSATRHKITPIQSL
jgi:hypothetical protein